MDNASPSLADIAAVCKDENGFGGSWLWIIVLFLFMWGNGGWGNRENMATSADVQRATDFAALERQNNETVAAVRQAAYDNMAFTKDGNYNTLSELRDIQPSIAANAANQQNCCCTTQRAIDGVNFNAANYTAAGSIEVQMMENGVYAPGARSEQSAAAIGDFAALSVSDLVTVKPGNSGSFATVSLVSTGATSVQTANVLVVKVA